MLDLGDGTDSPTSIVTSLQQYEFSLGTKSIRLNLNLPTSETIRSWKHQVWTPGVKIVKVPRTMCQPVLALYESLNPGTNCKCSLNHGATVLGL